MEVEKDGFTTTYHRALSSDGTIVFCIAGALRQPQGYQAWETRGGCRTELWKEKIKETVDFCTLSCDGSQCLVLHRTSNGQQFLAYYDVRSGRIICRKDDFEEAFYLCDMSADGSVLIVGSKLVVCDAKTGIVAKEILRPDETDYTTPFNYSRQVKLSANGKIAVVGYLNGTAEIWDIQKGRRLERLMVRRVHSELYPRFGNREIMLMRETYAISANGSVFLTAGGGKCCVWKIADMTQPAFVLAEDGNITSDKGPLWCAISADATIGITQTNRHSTIWNLKSGAKVYRVVCDHHKDWMRHKNLTIREKNKLQAFSDIQLSAHGTTALICRHSTVHGPNYLPPIVLEIPRELTETKEFKESYISDLLKQSRGYHSCALPFQSLKATLDRDLHTVPFLLEEVALALFGYNLFRSNRS
mmetsp:Transcript_8892/g.12463  ORF Transcript_8892/g.12463 Transcript_8892/m.12463 type:complete len:416 (+) Transcript_8892:229-1476(+)